MLSDEETGVGTRVQEGITTSSHVDHTVACLAEAGTPLSFPVYTPTRQTTYREMVEHTIRTVDPRVPVRLVHASRGKRVRAEPIAAKYEQHRVFHVEPLPLLEDQMTSWVPSERGRSGDTLDVGSPDRVDALVWALTDLLLDDVWGPVTGSGIA